jgi:molecular chaperone DnaK
VSFWQFCCPWHIFSKFASMSKVIGIDLGTTNSVVAVVEGGEPVVIVNQEGKRTTPSVVAFKPNGEILVGELAKRQAVTNPERTFYSVKRIIGKSYDEAKQEIDMLLYKDKIKPKGNHCVIEVDGKAHYPQEISAKVLMKLKQAAEAYLGHPVTEAVITVPAYFNDAQRKATKEAGEIAGLNVLRIINEPTAAALAYGVDKEIKNGKVAVFDLGGGTFDISILEISDGVFEVLSTSGDTHLGGDDFDERIVRFIIDRIKAEHGVDVTGDPKAMQRIREAAEQAKIELSSRTVTDITLPYLYMSPEKGVIDVNLQLTRAQFESMCSDLYERIKTPCMKAMEAANLKPSDIDVVVLVGGSTRMPRIRTLVQEIFGKEPKSNINPDEAVALGAAIQGAILKGEVKDILLLDVIPISLGVEIAGDRFVKMIEANTTIPVKRSEIFSTVVDNQTAVEIHILQGERPIASANKSLGRFILDGIPPAPRGVPQIEVTFDVDANGILHVTAVDKATNKSKSIRIEGGTSLPKEEIERLKKEAEMYAEEDKKKAELADLRVQIDDLLYKYNKLEQQAQECEECKKQIEEDRNKLLDLRTNDNIEEVRNKVMEIAARFYALSYKLNNPQNNENQTSQTEEVSTSNQSTN